MRAGARVAGLALPPFDAGQSHLEERRDLLRCHTIRQRRDPPPKQGRFTSVAAIEQALTHLHNETTRPSAPSEGNWDGGVAAGHRISGVRLGGTVSLKG
jgi:hypothetical protein